MQKNGCVPVGELQGKFPPHDFGKLRREGWFETKLIQ